MKPYEVSRASRALIRSTLFLAIASALPAYAQTCPTPLVVVDAACTVTTGTTVNVAGSGIGASASGASTTVTGESITLNLTGAGATGVLSQAGALVSLDKSTVETTSIGALAANQFGLRAIGAGSRITGFNTFVLLNPITGTSANLHAVSAENGGFITLRDSGAHAQSNGGTGGNALQAIGSGSRIVFEQGDIVTGAPGAFGAVALSGGRIDVTNAVLTTTGTASGTQGSHGLVASGAGSLTVGSGVNGQVFGTFTNVLRADAGGEVQASASSLTSRGSGNTLNPAAVARATSGGTVRVSAGSTLTATGQFGHGITVDDEGSQAFVSDSNVRVGGSRSVGLMLRVGGDATINNTTFLVAQDTLTGPWAPAVRIEGTGSVLTMTGGRLSTTPGSSHALQAIAGSATLTGTAIDTIGDYSSGIVAGNATVNATDVAITTLGNNNAMGVLADINSQVTFTRGSITTRGSQVATAANPHAMTARNPGGRLSAIGTVANTFGTVAIGAVADDGGTASLTDVAITTQGDRGLGLYSVVEQNGAQFAATLTSLRGSVETSGLNAHGAAAQARNDLPGPLASLTVTDARVTTHGSGATGLRATLANYGSAPSGRGEARVVANNTTVRTEGTLAHGALSRDAPTSVTINGGSVLATGQNAHGAVAEIGGRIVGTNTSVRASGANATGLFVSGNPGAVSSASFTTSDIANVSGPTIGVAGNGSVAMTDSTGGGSGQWLLVGTVADFPTLLADPPILGPGDPTDDDGNPPPPLGQPPAPSAPTIVPGLADITLTRSTVTGSAITVDGSVSNVTLVDARWNLTGDSNLTNLVNDPSLIDFSPPTAGVFKTLTVVNYSGDGTIALNTVLGDDSSPSDTLVVDGGNASGPSFLAIKPAGGAGAVTLANGILVVDAINGATTTPNAFSLSGRVVGGPYEYTLHRASVDATAPESWFLRSTIDCAAPGAPVPPCPSPPPPPPPPDPPTPPVPPPPIPNYRAEVSLYTAAIPTAIHYGRSLLDTLHERVGEQEQLRGRRDLDEDGRLDGMWGRLVYVDGERDSSRGIYRDGPSYDYTLGAVQLGHDLYRHEEAGEHRDHAGLYLAAGYAETEVDHYTGTRAGDDRVDAYTIGGYWTRYDAKDDPEDREEPYVDAVLQATWYEVRANPAVDLPRMETEGWGFAASLEGGYPFALDKGWLLEPQGQLIYQWFDFDDASDVAATVRFDDTDSLVGRLSARLSRDWIHHDDPDFPLQSTGWLRLGIWHEFKGEPVTEFSSDRGYIPFTADLGGTWWEAELALTREIDRNVFFYGNVGYSQGFDDDRRSWEGKIGLRADW